MTIERTWGIAAVVVSLLAPSPLRADGWLGGTFCFPGAFQACATVSVTSIQYLPPAGQITDERTLIVVSMINHDGHGGFPSSGAYGLVSFALSNLAGCIESQFGCRSYDPGIRLNPGVTMNLGDGTLVCAAPDCSNLGGWDLDDTPSTAIGAVAQAPGGYTRVFGCSPSGTDFSDYSTCTGGSVDILLLPLGNVQLTDASRLTVRGRNHDGSVRMECTIGETCVTVTPEPATLILLGSGMAGLALAKRRRRRASSEPSTT